MQTFVSLAILVFVESCVLSVSMQLTVKQILTPLANLRLIAAAAIVNFVAVPLTAIAICRLFELNEPQAIGLILLGCAAGATFLPKIIASSKGDEALAVSFMAFLMLVSLIYVPLVLPLVLAGVSVDAIKIGRSLLVTMVAPLAIGLLLKARFERQTRWMVTPLQHCTNISLVLLIVLIPVMSFRSLVEVASVRCLIGSVIFIVVSFLLGFAVGIDRRTRQVQGFAAAARNIPTALLVGSQNFATHVTSMIMVESLISLVILGLMVGLIRHRNRLSRI